MKYLKRFWNWLLGKTTIDEKIVEVAGEIKERAQRVKEELGDVKEDLKDVVEQASDVVDAAKGKKRRGRKPRKK